MPVKCDFCRRLAEGTCEHCSKVFCPDHGVIKEKTCNRCLPSVRQQKEDIERHRQKFRKNLGGLCAREGCSNPILAKCWKCGLSFCGRHINRRMVRVKLIEFVWCGFGRWKERELITQTESRYYCEECPPPPGRETVYLNHPEDY